MSTADIFLKKDAVELLRGKSILMFGDSNMRAIYKDLLWLLEDGKLLPSRCLKLKNEPSHAGDVNVSNGDLTSSRNYVEVRRYTKTCFVQFEFLTRLRPDTLAKTINEILVPIDYIVLSSVLWDITRWGPSGVHEFRGNVRRVFDFFKSACPNARIIWTTAFPPSFKARGGFLTEELNFLKVMLPFQVIEANNFVVGVAREFKIDIVDLHYYLRHYIDFRSPDGIHYEPKALRYVTNLLLTHISVSAFRNLPGRVPSVNLYDVRFGGAVGNIVRNRNGKRNRRRKLGYVRDCNNNNARGYNFNPRYENFGRNLLSC